MEEPPNRRRRAQRWILFGAALLLLGMLVGQLWGSHLVSGSFWREIYRVGQVMSLVNRAHVDQEQSAFPVMSERALREMVNGLDRHSRWMSDEEASNFEQSFRQQYSGIGVSIRPVEDGLEINEVFSNSPAETVGLLPRDVIIEAAGKELGGLTSTEAIGLIKGEKGTPVALAVRRPGEMDDLRFEVVRGDIPIENVRNVRFERPGIAVIEITEFGEKTAERFASSLDKLEREGMQGLVLDLRGNPGGSLLSAVAVTEQFLDKGDLIVSTRGRDTLTSQEFLSSTPARKKDYALVVLLDGASASASEIVAGALQEQANAIVVGERSVGKGSVQSYIPLHDGGAIKLTTAKWYLPSGKAVEGNGVEPDVPVVMTSRDRMRLFLQRRHDPKDTLNDTEFLERFGFEKIEDTQLKTALDILTAARFAGAN